MDATFITKYAFLPRNCSRANGAPSMSSTVWSKMDILMTELLFPPMEKKDKDGGDLFKNKEEVVNLCRIIRKD